jgi:hypothetical protein
MSLFICSTKSADVGEYKQTVDAEVQCDTGVFEYSKGSRWKDASSNRVARVASWFDDQLAPRLAKEQSP